MANVNWDKVTTLYELVKDGVVGRTEMKDGIRVARVQAGQRSVIRSRYPARR